MTKPIYSVQIYLGVVILFCQNTLYHMDYESRFDFWIGVVLFILLGLLVVMFCIASWINDSNEDEED